MYCCVSCACFHLCLWLAKCCDSFDCCILLRQHDKDPPPHKPGSPWGKPARYLQLRSFTFFCTTWSLLSTILNPASWWLSQSCDSYAAAFCCTDVSPNCTGNSGILVSGKIRMAPKPSKTTTAWWLASNLTDVPVAMKCQINNQFKPELPQHKPGSPGENCSPPTTSQLHLFCTTWSLLRTILDPASWWLSQSCDSYAAAFGCTDVGPNCTGNCGILVSRKIRMAPKPSKTTSAWWPASNLTHVQLFMKCQINNQKSAQHRNLCGEPLLHPRPCAATSLVCPILLKCKCSQTHWHTRQAFSESQHPDEA